MRSPEFNLSPQEAQTYLGLARQSLFLALEINPGSIPGSKATLSEKFEKPPYPGAFVTLWKHPGPGSTESGWPMGRELRGCIGHIQGHMPLSQAVEELVLESAFHDYRFRQLVLDEYPLVSLEITILSPPVSVPGWQDIRMGLHGIFLECRGHRAVFLPQVPQEQGWNLNQTLEALCRKAGLPARSWKEPDCSFQVFTGIQADEEHPHG